jgi:tRNA dimethylallyltransferase
VSKSLSQKPIIAVVGPTASGKSALAIEIALRMNGEIVNCDSVQIYKGIEIATAKIPIDERQGVPHHLLDFVSPEINYTAGEWAREAGQTIDQIGGRGRVALLVGGTGLYIRALRRPFFPSPPTDDALRQRLNRIREQRGPEHLHRMLRRLDPKSAEELFPRDWPRVQRALEVKLQTGQRMSEQKRNDVQPHTSARQLRLIALDPPRNELYERINQRTEMHFSKGLVEEVRSLLAQGVPANSNALGAHGYRRVVEYLRGERDLVSAIEQTKLDVRHYAKRQMTWFRREPDVTWFKGFGEVKSLREQVLGTLTETVYAKTE